MLGGFDFAALLVLQRAVAERNPAVIERFHKPEIVERCAIAE
jgi:hypothetical protein